MIPIYIISLKDHSHRLKKLIKRLHSLEIFDYQIIKAFDGRNINVHKFQNYLSILRKLLYGKDLLGPEIGCFMSHLQVYNHMIKNKCEHSIVFEDDVVLTDDFKNTIELLDKIKPMDFNLIRFLGKDKLNKIRKREIYKINDKHSIYRLHASPGGTYSYFITLNGAMILKSKMKKIFTAIDTLMGLQFYTGLSVYTVLPKISSWNENEISTIGEERYRKKLKGPYKLVYPFTRFLFKIIEELSKILIYYCFFFKDKKIYKKSIYNLTK